MLRSSASLVACLALVLASLACLAVPIGAPAQPATAVPAAPAATATSDSVQVVGLPPAGHRYHGVYPGGITGEEDDLTLADLRSYETAAGQTAAWVYFSHNWYRDRQFPMTTAAWIRDAGSVPYIRLMLRSDAEQNHAEPVFSLDRIIAGDFDDDLHRWFAAARDFGTPLVVEFGTEVNGEWFSWNGMWNGAGRLDGYGENSLPDGPERFQDAYRRLVQISREAGARNLIWIFHVNNVDLPELSWNGFEHYYPGGDWVDWIAVSAYGALTPQEEGWASFRGGMDAAYPRLEALAGGKPIVLAEFGVTLNHPLGDQAEWAGAALADLTAPRWPGLIGFSWWNERWQNDGNPDHDTTMRLQDNPALAQVFQQFVGQNELVDGRVTLAGCCQ